MVAGGLFLVVGYVAAPGTGAPSQAQAQVPAVTTQQSDTPTAAPQPTVPKLVGAPAFADNFERPDSTTVGPGWSQSGPAGCAIRSGRVVAEKRLSNCYLSRTLPGRASALLVNGSWSGQGGLEYGVTLIASTDHDYSLNNMIHFNVRPGGWILQFRTAGGTFDNIADGPLNLPVDGTVSSWGMFINGDTVTLKLPDGTVRQVTDPRVSKLDGPYITYEMGSIAGQVDSRVDAMSAYAAG
jgi:hypothetical protein